MNLFHFLSMINNTEITKISKLSFHLFSTGSEQIHDPQQMYPHHHYPQIHMPNQIRPDYQKLQV